MTAYRNNFAVVIPQAVASSGTGLIYEPVMVNHELVTNNEGDIVMAEVSNAS